MTTHSETSERDLSAPVPSEGETWVRYAGATTKRVTMYPDDLPPDVVTTNLADQRQLLIDAGYRQWHGPTITNHDHDDPRVPTAGCCSPDADAGMVPTQGAKSQPPGSVDMIVAHLRDELDQLRAEGDTGPGRVTSIWQAREELRKAEERAVAAFAYVEEREQRARDIEAALERLVD